MYLNIASLLTMCFQVQVKDYTESFRLQKLQPYTDYVVQMRCVRQDNLGYWSDWSQNATARTPEASESLLNVFPCFTFILYGQNKR